MKSSDLRIARPRNGKTIAIWLYCVAFLVFLIIMVGGATRLTNSGLSIVHWSPISGVIPPLNASDWQQEFELYQKIPEYILQNQGMNLAEFKRIFWWEWAHRLLGRVIGFAVLIPLLVLGLGKKLSTKDVAPLFTIALLVGLQGLIGWWMVSSGLDAGRVDVASYRLAAHLGMGFFLLGLLLKLATEYWGAVKISPLKSNFWTAILSLVFIQVILGAFTAGSHAGLVHNDWPKIDGHWLPQEYLRLQPIWENFSQNTQTIQFNHRIMAYVIFGLLAFDRVKHRFNASNATQKNANWAFFACLAQVILGISLLSIFGKYTPPHVIGVNMGVAHQALAAIFFGLVVLAWLSSHKTDKQHT